MTHAHSVSTLLLLGLIAVLAAACAASTPTALPEQSASAQQTPGDQPAAPAPSAAQSAPASSAAATNAPKKPLSAEEALKEELDRAPFDARDWKTNFTKRTVRLNDFLGGGPPKDGIPSIDSPKFVSVKEADKWLEDPEAVEVVDIKGDVRAYPAQIMIWHEIVNDVVGGEPIIITY